MPRELDALRSDRKAIEPLQRVADFVRLEAVGSELTAQLLRLRASVAAPVIFVDEYKHFEHGLNIAHLLGSTRARCADATPKSTWKSADGDSLKQAARQARDVSVEFQFEQPALQLGRAVASACTQRVQAHRVEAEVVQQA